MSKQPNRIWRGLLISVLLVLTYDLVNRTPYRHLRFHSRSAPNNGFLSTAKAQTLCSTYDLSIFPERAQHRKIYDLMLVSTELDWLEVRMNELKHHVDYFVIVESAHTFTQKPKPLHFKENFTRFAPFQSQILYHNLDISSLGSNSTWEREAFLRNGLFDSVFPSLVGDAEPLLNDVILVSDVDEIPRPSTLNVLRNCAFPERVTLRSRFFYYSFQWQHVGDEWHHPQATFYQGPEKTIKPEDLRMGGGALDLWNASWHCSSCFSTVAEMAKKLESFSHTEYNKPEFREPQEIVRRVRNGLDLFDREGQLYERVQSGYDAPQYVKANKERFSYMLDRDAENANFKDYTSE
ncbi:glycosyl transferase family 17 protein, variant [Blastomyces gilchristii SLH14081]|uniref:Glycosyl transferase family 17 protein n=1 Tax=Blastomyces gilchristii (strain SLH14081) TaxID=559298 RepID=A0A179USM5_BLAGS|nr:glycosyl transferase family 17 protein [Blastomyces gilchristii SLH14081]XP_031579507.1 glycosyl transferase family 17 protein, variant [Blastomyces gilchristii SLH14081]OAT10782.1 glycosyl transferase family 17 protein [Blastomyces gilchristii SLH14081]OAT10783.1 glycosyl transferase family 17 protein, variant [Blastomyces gilchristii SLH14081]